MDLLTLQFLTAYLTRPLHFFGKWGMVSGLAGSGTMIWLLIRKLLNPQFSLMQEHGPLMVLGCLLVVMGMLLLATGLIGEFMARIYFESSRARTYAVKKEFRNGRNVAASPARVLAGWRSSGQHLS